MQEPGPQVIRLFFSCPGDLDKAKGRLGKVAREVSNLFREYGVSVDVWRHEIAGQLRRCPARICR